MSQIKKEPINTITNKTFVMFSQEERDNIMKDYNEITKGDKEYSTYSLLKLANATQGMYLISGIDQEENLSEDELKKILCNTIKKSYSNGDDPIVHEDSMTAWGNRAVELFGLEIGDIIKMKAGDKIKVCIMDRNVGDYMIGTNVGTKYDPTKEGMEYGTYIHKEGLSGIMTFEQSGRREFTWEINNKPYGGLFWDVIDSKTNIYELDPKTKIGWRGPAITQTNAKKYMPKTVTHYGTWWNDYLVWRYTDFLNMK